MMECVEDEVIPLIRKEKEVQYYLANGSIEYFKENYKAAITAFHSTDFILPFELNVTPTNYDRLHLMLLGISYFKSNNLTEAITIFEKLLSTYDIDDLYRPMFLVEMHYYLGMAYEIEGRIDEAIQKYEDFLDIWRDADTDIKSLIDAKERLAFLKGKT